MKEGQLNMTQQKFQILVQDIKKCLQQYYHSDQTAVRWVEEDFVKTIGLGCQKSLLYIRKETTDLELILKCNQIVEDIDDFQMEILSIGDFPDWFVKIRESVLDVR